MDNETMKILGVHFCPTRSTYKINENWDRKIQSMIDTIKLWNKTFFVSKFIYLLQSIHIPKIVMQKKIRCTNSCSKINFQIKKFLKKLNEVS